VWHSQTSTLVFAGLYRRVLDAVKLSSWRARLPAGETAYITAGDEEEWTRERATVIDVTPEK
jgi:hypothetical protein